ncbi:MAG: bifunctional (p)ppGpp synthetase/guanosine-3',5'-bis(diphosphate) 3'-pyrophosphohydrolase [Desulfuromonadales bacterium]|nr:bifunctional (p)ppGpp synthetase/guanosine-3',5'-bis(diphosphate) 3'-pyrophosphohydrolase [Desulfuromonadales bacterium]
MISLDDILDEVRAHNPGADFELIRNAYAFAVHAHAGQVRRSGNSYITHLLEVSLILARFKMDTDVVASGLLHDVIEDTEITLDTVRTEFGDSVATLVDSVTKIGRIAFNTREERQAESFRKMLLAMARDLRVIIIKLADRLHNMRTLEFLPEPDQQQIARETQEIYAPLANRLGISSLKGELEDLSFRYLEPDAYQGLMEKISVQKAERETYIEDIRCIIKAKLDAQEIVGDVSGRSKHLYSIHKKMQRQNIEFDQVQDLSAFRIIVGSVRDCYAALGIIHAAWRPVPGRFKDFIAMPKANLYQSLHTTVIGPYGERMEVQIRTEEMHRIAEEGIAAHWKYKEAGQSVIAGPDASHFRWLRQMLEWQQEVKDSHEFLDVVRVELFPEEVYVFTPNGDVQELPKGSTPVDFAFSVHSDIGFHCVGAKVNGRMVPLKTQLNNGDRVEVLTSDKQKPSKDWLTFVKSSKARNRIRQWVKAEQRERSIELGKSLLEKDLRKHGFSLNRIIAGKILKPTLDELGFTRLDDLLANLGYGKISVGQIINRLIPKELLKETPASPGKLTRVLEKIRRKPSGAIKVQGVDDVLVRFAKCCNPLPGDEIVGFVTRGQWVAVHTADCPHLLEIDPARQVDVEWDVDKTATRSVTIRVICADRKGMLATLSAAISEAEANILSASVHLSSVGDAINLFEIEVSNLKHLNQVTNCLRRLKGVHKVERLQQ